VRQRNHEWNTKKLEKGKPLIHLLKNYTSFHLQEFTLKHTLQAFPRTLVITSKAAEKHFRPDGKQNPGRQLCTPKINSCTEKSRLGVQSKRGELRKEISRKNQSQGRDRNILGCRSARSREEKMGKQTQAGRAERTANRWKRDEAAEAGKQAGALAP
jgi:hypothetical protein